MSCKCSYHNFLLFTAMVTLTLACFLLSLDLKKAVTETQRLRDEVGDVRQQLKATGIRLSNQAGACYLELDTLSVVREARGEFSWEEWLWPGSSK